jgi:hypothetical protein
MTVALPKKRHWLPAGPPGHRFRNRYHAHQRSRRGRGIAGMVGRFLLSAVAAAIGFVLVFIPGPAVLFFLISGALLAADWLPVARLLDWGEVRGRQLWDRARRLWSKLSRPARVAVVATVAAAGAAATYGFYLVVR